MDRPEGDIWIFGYGSLMWRPNFPFTAAAPALLRGYHRSLCIYSTEYRGTWERPGLVLGLDRGGSCRGQAMKVADKDADEVIAYLHERELVSRLSEAEIVKLILQGRGKMGTCLDYVQNLVHHLDELGIADGPLHRLVRQAEEAEV